MLADHLIHKSAPVEVSKPNEYRAPRLWYRLQPHPIVVIFMTHDNDIIFTVYVLINCISSTGKMIQIYGAWQSRT